MVKYECTVKYKYIFPLGVQNPLLELQDHLLLSVYYQRWEVEFYMGDSYCQVLGSRIKICPYQ